jgi:hypothetical protein
MTPRRYGPKSSTRPLVYAVDLHIKVSAEQDTWLDAEAIRQDCTVAEVIRRLIEQVRTQCH